MLFTQEEVAFIMQVSKSNQENYLETQKRGKKRERKFGFVSLVSRILAKKGDTVENITCSAKPCQGNQFIDCNVIFIRSIFEKLTSLDR